MLCIIFFLTVYHSLYDGWSIFFSWQSIAAKQKVQRWMISTIIRITNRSDQIKACLIPIWPNFMHKSLYRTPIQSYISHVAQVKFMKNILDPADHLDLGEVINDWDLTQNVWIGDKSDSGLALYLSIIKISRKKKFLISKLNRTLTITKLFVNMVKILWISIYLKLRSTSRG